MMRCSMADIVFIMNGLNILLRTEARSARWSPKTVIKGDYECAETFIKHPRHYLEDEDEYALFKHTFLSYCKDLCVNYTEFLCRSFSYDPEYKDCYILKGSIEDKDLISSNTFDHYSRICRLRPSATTPTTQSDEEFTEDIRSATIKPKHNTRHQGKRPGRHRRPRIRTTTTTKIPVAQGSKSKSVSSSHRNILDFTMIALYLLQFSWIRHLAK